jgi:hypothetical protein
VSIVGDADQTVLLEVAGRAASRRATTTRRRQRRTTKPAHSGAPPRVVGVDAHVAHLGRGHDHDLAAVRRVGEHLLVAGHRGVEDHLAEGLAGGAEADAAIDRAVLEGQKRRFTRAPVEIVGRPTRPVRTRRAG